MKVITSMCWLAVVAALCLGVVGCKKSPQRVTTIPGQKPGEIQGEAAAKPIEPKEAPGPIKVEPNPTPIATQPTPPPITGSGLAATSKDFSTWKPDTEIFAAQTVHFDFDKSVVKVSEVPKVEEVAKRMKEMPGKALRIEGHCDERGTEEYNRALGERRALALREKLVMLGVDKEMVETISYGKDKPVDPGHNDAAWAKNRRGVFVLLTPPAGGS